MRKNDTFNLIIKELLLFWRDSDVLILLTPLTFLLVCIFDPNAIIPILISIFTSVFMLFTVTKIADYLDNKRFTIKSKLKRNKK